MSTYIPRYWSISGSTIPVDSHGFLIDTSSMIGQTQREGLRQITTIPERVSVLLGGSGIGKSTDFGFAEKHVGGSYVHRIDLLQHSKEAISNGNLKRSITESAAYAQALEQNLPVILLIDSFDECAHMERKLVHSITSQLKSVLRPTDSVLIASRPDDLTGVLIDTLKSEFEPDSVAVYQMAPLSRFDVIDYAERHGVDPNSFMQYILDHDLTEFAANPQLLTFLVEAFRNDTSVVYGRAGLYQLHLLKLLETSNRSTSSKMPTITNGEILDVAERCALATVFSGRSRISLSSMVRDDSKDFVSYDELIHSPRRIDDHMLSINKAILEEVLSTPLFRIHFDSKVEWHHRSYAEYLAAVALSKSNLKASHILSLFTTTVLTERSVPSQLFLCASFLVELRPDLFEGFLELDPEIYVVADIRHLNDNRKACIVDSILHRYELGRAYDRIDLRRRYRQLAHPTLADQLRPIVSSSKVNAVVRRAAIDIAQECNVVDVLPQLLELALDSGDRLPDRVQAVHAINHLGDAVYMKELRRLLHLDNDADPESELRGSVLQGLWPYFMEVSELATVLTAIKVPHLFGSYFHFVQYHLPDNVGDDDLPKLLSIQTILLDKPDAYNFYDHLTLVVVSRSLSYIVAREDICSALCIFILASARRGKSVLRLSSTSDTEALHRQVVERIESEVDLRRTLLSQLSATVVDAQRQISEVMSEYECLVNTADLEWYIEQLDTNLSGLQSMFYCSLIQVVANWSDSASVDKVLTAALRHQDLRELLRDRIEPVDLDSEKAAQMREWNSNSRNREIIQPQDHKSLLIQHLQNFLDNVLQGDLGAWIRICDVMSRSLDTGFMEHTFEPNIADTPLWAQLDEHDHDRLCDAAMEYLGKHQMQGTANPGLRQSWESLAGYKAIVLLHQMRYAQFLRPDSDLYSKWIPSAMFYPTGYGMGDDEMHAHIITAAYAHSSTEVLDSFKTLLQHEVSCIRDKGVDKLKDPSEALLFCQHKLSLCWDVEVERLLMDVIQENVDLPQILPSLLSFMLEHESDSAKEYVFDALESRAPDNDIDRFRWIVCAVEAISYSKPEEWSRVWSILLGRTELSKDAFLDYVYKERYSSNHLMTRLTERQQSDVYIWLERQFPHDSDPVHEGAHMVSARDMIGEYRDNILRVLKSQGTTDAVVELERIQAEFPELQWLSYTLIDARKKAHEFSWNPIEPADLFAHLSDGECRLVRSEYDLRDVLVESLHRLSDRLQGHTPMAEFLWNTDGDGKYTPKDETALSNYIKSHLESELHKPSRIVVNREVVIDGRGHLGKKTDIHVDCLSINEDSRRLKAVIEVKCCWNKELNSAMEDQLVGLYLNDSNCNVGIYVVGLFDCETWDTKHRISKACKHGSKEDVSNVLLQQAKELSNESRIIFPYVLDVSLNR